MAEFQALRYFRLQCTRRRNLAINFKGRVQEGWLRGWRDWRLDVVDFCKMKMKKKEYVIISLLT